MNKIIPSFGQSLFEPSKDLLADISELGIDSILDDGLFKDLPIVKILIGIKNVTQNLQERNALIQNLNFIKEFNSGTINISKLQNYRNSINSDNKKAEKELGRVLIILNNTIELEKTKMLANLFRNYINGFINWFDFCELSEIVGRLFLSDLEYLKKIYEYKIKDTKLLDIYRIERLSSLGLINTSSKEQYLIDPNGKYEREEKFVAISEIGIKFYKSIILN